VRPLCALLVVLALPARAGVTVPADLGIGPEGVWFFGPLTDNRGAVPHFALSFNLHAVIDKEWIEANQHVIPQQYKRMASGIEELRIGASIFIPSRLYISPPIDALGGTGMFGATWSPLGLTLLSTGQKSSRDWNKSRGRFILDTHLLLTYLFVFNTLGRQDVPTTHFLRPGLELKATILIAATERFLVSLGGGAQVYVPQRLGTFIEFVPLNEAMWLSAFAFLKFHFRFPYEVSL
jgi:hypothetical protein